MSHSYAGTATVPVRSRAKEPPLVDALSAMLPDSESTLFLRACLQEGDALRESWTEWCRRVEPLPYLRREGPRLARHLPLLYTNVKANHMPIPAGVEPYFRTAVVHERLRFERFGIGLGRVLHFLREARIDVTLLKGVAIARTVHASPALRHCHDLDVLVVPEDRAAATAALPAAEFHVTARTEGTVRIAHASGLPIAVHTALLSNPIYPVPTDTFLAGRETIDHEGERVPVLCPPDMLVHVCGHASTSSRRPTGNWVIDSGSLLRRYPALDWRRVVDLTTESGLALPMYVLLGYLGRELASPIPAWVLGELGAAASRSDAVYIAAAIDGACRGRPGGLGRTLRRSGWPSRLKVLRRRIVPHP